MKQIKWLLLVVALCFVVIIYFLPTSKKATQNISIPQTENYTLVIDSIKQAMVADFTPVQHSNWHLLDSIYNNATDTLSKIDALRNICLFLEKNKINRQLYLWYTGKKALLENSEKNLTFAAQLFLEHFKLSNEDKIRNLDLGKAKELFEKSLMINAENAEAKVGMAFCYIFATNSSAEPMKGISMLREVLSKDSMNVFALMTMGYASEMSGQADKAIEKFEKVLTIEPNNVEAGLVLADVYQQSGNSDKAIGLYKKMSSKINNKAIKEMIEGKISMIENKN